MIVVIAGTISILESTDRRSLLKRKQRIAYEFQYNFASILLLRMIVRISKM